MGCQVSPHGLLQTPFVPAEIFQADFRSVVVDEVEGFFARDGKEHEDRQ